MICPSCTEHNHDDVKFCRHCGARMERRTCDNGHTIPDGLSDCPYCPKKTVAEPPPTAEAGAGGHPGTLLVPPEELEASGVTPAAAEAIGAPPAVAPGRKGTVVVGPGMAGEGLGGAGVAEIKRRAAAAVGGDAGLPQAGTSPLVGFVVSFSLDPNGVYWPLRYGRTRIGSAEGSQVRLAHAQVSGDHARILVHDNQGTPKIWCEDCGSSNGTQLNGQGVFNDRPDVHSGDLLTVGPIELKLLLLD